MENTAKVSASVGAALVLLLGGACGTDEPATVADPPATGATASDLPSEPPSSETLQEGAEPATEEDPLAVPSVNPAWLGRSTDISADIRQTLEVASEGFKVEKGAQTIVSGNLEGRGPNRVIAVACGQDVLNESPAIVAFGFDRTEGSDSFHPLPINEMPSYEELYPWMDYWQQRQAEYSALAEAMIAKTC